MINYYAKRGIDMKRKKSSLKKLLSIAVSGAFLLVGIQTIGAQEEAYDEDTYGPANPIIWTKPVKGVVFSHKTHTLGAGLDCDSCHSGMFEMAAGTAEENEDFTMQSLYDGNYCGSCHDGSMAFASNTRCTSCHVGVKGYNRLTGSGGQSGH
jgi:c(7)-type cytochrome triheme protein